MKHSRFFGSFALIAVAAIQFLISPARAANNPVWSFTVPTSTLVSSSSMVTSIVTDVAGDTFIVIQHSSFFMNIPFPAGTQLILLNGRGKLVGSADFPALNNITPVSVGGKKAIISAGSLQELIANSDKTLTAALLPFQGVDETLANVPLAEAVDRPFVHSSISTAGKVSEIRCYALKKLKP